MRWNMRWLMGLLALAMLLGPTLGQMHRAVHAGIASSSKAYVAHSHLVQAAKVVLGEAVLASDCRVDSRNCTADLSWVHALFAGHGPAECQLLDQANHGYAGPPALLAFAAPAPALALPAPFAPVPRSIFLAAPFAARAPPLTFSSWA